MKGSRGYAIVLVTVPGLKVGRTIARALLMSRVAACVNIVPGLESHYWWQGRMEKSNELLLLIKTERGKLKSLETRLLDVHPYDTPEFLVLPIETGNQRYLEWLSASLTGG